jgi:hypothetical protein
MPVRRLGIILSGSSAIALISSANKLLFNAAIAGSNILIINNKKFQSLIISYIFAFLKSYL